MNKKGQVDQIFIWIFVAVVAVAILIFGVKLIKQGDDLKDEVLIVKFFNDFQKKTEQFYFLDRGSSGDAEFLLPSDARYVCFVNNTPASNYSDNIPKNDIEVMGNLSSNFNVFIGPLNSFQENKFNATTKLNFANPSCFNVNGKIKINFENLGVRDGVKIQ